MWGSVEANDGRLLRILLVWRYPMSTDSRWSVVLLEDGKCPI